MIKKIATTAVITLGVTTICFTAASQAAATVKNGVACAKSGASTIVTVKGVKNTYICTVNPAAANNPNIAKSGLTWTLKTCVSYYAAYKSNQQSINDQRSLVSIMNDPDKTTYTTQLDASQASLMKVLSAIENNYCKTGL
jgi:hypothetical protein